MAMELKEVVELDVPAEVVWRFLLSPVELATCMPGAEITELVDDQNFKGTVKMRVGAISVKYAGTVKYESVEADAHRVVLRLKADEASGGTVSGSISAELTELSHASTRVDVLSSIDLTGRLVQVGRGMIDGVARQVIGTFVKNVEAHLSSAEASEEAVGSRPLSDRTGPVPKHEDSLNVTALVWRAFIQWIRSIYARVAGRLDSRDSH